FVREVTRAARPEGAAAIRALAAAVVAETVTRVLPLVDVADDVDDPVVAAHAARVVSDRRRTGVVLQVARAVHFGLTVGVHPAAVPAARRHPFAALRILRGSERNGAAAREVTAETFARPRAEGQRIAPAHADPRHLGL